MTTSVLLGTKMTYPIDFTYSERDCGPIVVSLQDSAPSFIKLDQELKQIILYTDSDKDVGTY